MEESGTKNVEIPAEDNDWAISWPPYLKIGIVKEDEIFLWEDERRCSLRYYDSIISVMRCRFEECFYRF